MTEWFLDADAGCIVHRATDYDIPLEFLRRPIDCASWVLHVAEKSWATSEAVEDLLEAITLWSPR